MNSSKRNSSSQRWTLHYDPVALHTVASACHGILHDLASAKGIKQSIKDSPLIAEHARKEFIKAVNAPQNFFKHAHKDPDATITFRHNVTPIFILDAIVLVAALGSELTYEMRVFCMWIQLRFPDVLCFEPAEADLEQIRRTHSDPAAFRAIAKALLHEHSPRLTASHSLNPDQSASVLLG